MAPRFDLLWKSSPECYISTKHQDEIATNEMRRFELAGAAELLTAAQKDDHYVRYFKNLISELIQQSLGVRHWIKWRDKYDLVANFLYFYLTSGSGYQTLGEEYVHIVQVDPSLMNVPSKQRRILDVALLTFGNYLLKMSLLRLEKIIKDNHCSTSTSGDLSTKLINYLHLLNRCFSFLQHLHLVNFYFYGRYYYLSKRLAGINYVLLRRWLAKPSSYYTPYKVLSWITALQLMFSVSLEVHSAFAKRYANSLKEVNLCSNQGGKDDSFVSAQRKCSLCLEKRKHSTSTPCGHLFCWYCINEWMQSKEECPVCREKFITSRLVYLHNFD